MTTGPRHVERTSWLAAPADVVWARVVSFDGIDDELRPLLRMTAPRGWRDLSPELLEAHLGERLFRSWLLLFGLVPVDYDDLTIVELDPGRRFLERSRMLSASVWQHERAVEPTGPGSCRVVDRVTWVPRARLFAPVLALVVPRLFSHRHRRLRRALGETATIDSKAISPTAPSM